jgi:hypothetical protein
MYSLGQLLSRLIVHLIGIDLGIGNTSRLIRSLGWVIVTMRGIVGNMLPLINFHLVAPCRL